jgi:hypothetical protein
MTGSGAFVLRWGADVDVPSDVERIVLHAGRDERWLLLDSPERFAAWAEDVAGRCSAPAWTTIDGLNDWPVRAYASGLRTLATGRLLRAFDHQLAGHVLARRAIWSVQPAATVDVGLVHHDVYELEGLLRDALAAPGEGVTRAGLREWLRARRAEHERRDPPPSAKAWIRRRLFATAIPLELALPRSLGAVYALAAEVAG